MGKGENLKEYLEGVTEQVLGRGVTRQLDAFREGFDEVFPLRHLAVFMPEELEQHIRGDSEPWDLETLRASVLADHGFSETSMPIVWLLNIIRRARVPRGRARPLMRRVRQPRRERTRLRQR